MSGNKSSVRSIAKILTSIFLGKPFNGQKGGMEPYQNFREGPIQDLQEMNLNLSDSQIKLINNNYVGLKSYNKVGLINLLLMCVLLITISLFIMYFSEKSRAEREGEDPKSISELLGFTSGYKPMAVIVGMTTNLIFGFIDNAGLFFGMSALDPYLPEGELLKAGLGNTFSDALGSFLGTFIGTSIQNYSGVTEWPLYAEVIGIIIGCLIGVFLPASFMGVGRKGSDC